MSIRLEETIAALASPPGGAARGILRISGGDLRKLLAELYQPDDPARWASARGAERHAGRIVLSGLRAPLDCAVHLWPTQRSYTGEPMAELHLPGSPPLLEAVLSALHERGARPARPGEFTLRAFLAGRIDLVQAEGVLGVIEAHDHRELETALGQLAGGLSGKIAAVRGDLLDLLADLEAGLDFVDEDIEFVSRPELAARVERAREAVERLLDQASQRMRSAGTLCVVLAGLPNAGKSTLFNALVGREAALVSPVRGTTRDWLSAEFDRQGLSIELIDTAGWEREHPAVSRAAPHAAADAEIMAAAELLRDAQFERADLVVWCSATDLDEAAQARDAALVARLHAESRPVLRVRTRSDLAPCGVPSEELIARSVAFPGTRGAAENESREPAESPTEVATSALAGIGLAELSEAIVARLSVPHSGGREFVGTTASRAQDSLGGAAASLRRARDHADSGVGEEIVALDLRESLDHLGRILGAVYTDDILDRIFSRFCIGK